MVLSKSECFRPLIFASKGDDHFVEIHEVIVTLAREDATTLISVLAAIEHLTLFQKDKF